MFSAAALLRKKLENDGKREGSKSRLARPLTNKQRCGRTLFSFKSGAGEFQSASVFLVARNLALGLSNPFKARFY
jgi:hypothetical protein